MYVALQQMNSTHTAMVHDLQYDYYGNRIATCASDGFIHIYENNTIVATIKVRDSPLWSLSWAHPRFGGVLAVSSFDGEVSIWKDLKGDNWQKVAAYQQGGSVNSVAWAPHEYELILAACSSDGQLILLENANQWDRPHKHQAHEQAIHSVTWAPHSPDYRRLATASSDKSIKIWDYDWMGEFKLILVLEGHKELVRDVKWNPLQSDLLVSGSEDGTIVIWKLNALDSDHHQPTSQLIQQFNLHIPVWKVAFSLFGDSLLASLSSGNGETTIQLLTSNQNGLYEIVQTIHS